MGRTYCDQKAADTKQRLGEAGPAPANRRHLSRDTYNPRLVDLTNIVRRRAGILSTRLAGAITDDRPIHAGAVLVSIWRFP